MKPGGPWNLRGLRPEARAAAREAARRSGMSVGEWLNDVIAPVDEDGEDEWFGHADRGPDDRWKQRSRYGAHQHERYAEPSSSWRRRESFADDDEREHYRRRAPPRRYRDHEPDEWRHSFRDDEERGRYRDPPRRRQRDPEGPYRSAFRDDDGDAELYRDPPPSRRPRHRSENHDNSEAPAREGRPYRLRPDQGVPARAGQKHVDPQESKERRRADADRFESVAEVAAAEERRDASIDKAVAEIAARQRALDGGGVPAPEPESVAAPAVVEMPSASPLPASSASPRPAAPASPPREPERVYHAWSQYSPSQTAADPAFSLAGLEDRLREITARIESLRPSHNLESAIDGLRNDLAEIGRTFTEALPRRALESLEIEIKALAQRIDHSRQSGIDSPALAGVEHGLAEIREALRSLMPAEGLVGFGDAVQSLSKRIDSILAKDDPAALQQLETAIGALRGIVSHVASNDTLNKVAEDVRALAAKVDGLAAGAPSSPTLTAIENRIDILATALNASTEAGHAVPRELEKLLSGLIEKLEWVQLTQTDHTALAHLEDRIAKLVKRLDASDARLGLLEGIERGLSDLLVYIDQIRGPNSNAVGNRISSPAVAQPLELSQPIEDAPPLAPAATARHDHFDPVPGGMTGERSPIDPSLPPDHPLEPGSAPGRSRPTASPAERIAASEAVVGPKPPVIPDPGAGKPDFIAAARRAAQAAAAAAPEDKRTIRAAVAADTVQPQKNSGRVRTLMVAGAVVVIVIGGFHFVSRMFEDGSTAPSQSEPARPQPTPEVQTEPPTEQPPAPAQTEPPHVELTPAPAPVPTAAPPSEPAQVPAMPVPNATTPPAAMVPGHQLQRDGAGTPMDITGSVSNTPLPAASASTSGDKLPIAIGGPALRLAALAGDPAAEYEVGVRFAEGHGVPANNQEAARWFEMAAKKGLAPAQFRLGALYEKGQGVKKDIAAARELYRAAADKGHGKAMHNLAVIYAEGADGKADYQTAAQWFRKAADRGITDSQYNLAILYARGVGVEKNLSEAYKWFFLAAKEGDQDAAQKRDDIAARFDQQTLAAARTAAEKWTALPQPAEAVPVNGAWDAPPSAAPAAKPKPKAPKAAAADVPKMSAKIN
jgi:localization factor PodJL